MNEKWGKNCDECFEKRILFYQRYIEVDCIDILNEFCDRFNVKLMELKINVKPLQFLNLGDSWFRKKRSTFHFFGYYYFLKKNSLMVFLYLPYVCA